jgi:hypothetical protein
MDGHIYIPRPGDREIILQNLEYFRKMDDEQLQVESEAKKKLGIFGVHQQALHLIAFNIVMKERFNDSPIEIVDNCLIRFKDNPDIRKPEK